MKRGPLNHVISDSELDREIDNLLFETRVRREVVSETAARLLREVFGRRLRAAGIPVETRKVLLGHRNGDITTHYSAPELEELLEAANRVCDGKSGTGCAETKRGYRWRGNRLM